ncbi:MAG: PEP-CTERM sorting domain-containing protein [Lacipirellulaceae bacterium]
MRWTFTALSLITAACALPSVAQANAVPVFFDSFDVTAAGVGTNLSAEAGAPRQGGPLVPVSYLQNVNDYHTQLLGAGPLQLAGDGGFPAPGQTMASPDYNFVGSAGGDLILGKCITLTMDAGAFVGGSAVSYITAGVSIGAAAGLTVDDAAASHFGVRFVEDNFGGFGSFAQFFDGASLVQNVVVHPAGAGPIDLRLDINDLVDGNPWDGVGSTTIDVNVNGTLVYSYTKGGGGYTSNFITMMGTPDFAGFDLATHTFDNLTVYAAPIPEPTGIALLLAGVLGVSARRARS